MKETVVHEPRVEAQLEREAAYLAALEPRLDDPLLRSLVPPVAAALLLPDGLLRSVERSERRTTKQPRSKPKELRDALARKTPAEVSALAAKLLQTMLFHLHENPSVATVWQRLGRIVLDALAYPRPWSDRRLYDIGARALAFLTRVHGDLVEASSGWQPPKRGRPRREVLRLTVTAEFRSRVREMRGRHRVPSLWCVAPPVEWENERDGGFRLLELRQRYPLLRGKQDATDAGPSADTLFAVNALQRTAWQINSSFLDAISRLPQAVVNKVLQKTLRKGTVNLSLDELRLRLRRRLRTAKELREAQALYSVIRLDDRGRFYPVVGTSVKVQGDDLALALLRFAPPDAPANPGLRARADVALRLAATDHYGPLPHDARPLPYGAQFANLVGTRLTWVREHEPEILATAEDPAGTATFWTQAKKPWQFLAWCIEWANHGRECPEQSTLPVRADCTASVYQHLACLLRSQRLAQWTNLTAETARVDHSPADLYNEIAKRLQAWVVEQSDRPRKASNAEEREALTFLMARSGQVFTRDLVKSPAMTWAYGALRWTLAKKFQDGVEKVLQDGPVPRVGPVLVRGLEVVLKKEVPEVPSVRDWLASVAADRKKPIEWSVPVAGFRAWTRRSYTHERVRQLSGEINNKPVRPSIRLGRRFDPLKHARAFMPNYIHSLDAAVVTLAIGQLATDGGVTELATIHDAFVTTPPRLDAVQAAVREAMHRLYTTGPVPLLRNLTDQLRAAGLADVPLPPSLGTYDLDQLPFSLMLHA